MGCGSSNAQVAALNDSNTEKQTDEGQTMEANEDEERPKSYRKINVFFATFFVVKVIFE